MPLPIIRRHSGREKVIFTASALVCKSLPSHPCSWFLNSAPSPETFILFPLLSPTYTINIICRYVRDASNTITESLRFSVYVITFLVSSTASPFYFPAQSFFPPVFQLPLLYWRGVSNNQVFADEEGDATPYKKCAL